MTTPDRAETGEVDQFLALLGRELTALAGTVETLQAALGPCLVEAAQADAGLVASIQQLDIVQQTLAELGRVAAQVQPSHDAAAVQAALDGIVLADLRLRLGTPGPLPREAADDVEFF